MKSYITNIYEKVVMAVFVWAGQKVMLIELHRIQQKAMNKAGHVLDIKSMYSKYVENK